MKVAAVIVTYNGKDYLKNCIDAVKAQTQKLDKIIVVNNSSTDGTTEWLNQQSDLHHILQPNSGSSGGQYTGIKTAFEEKCDWVWCLDQDIIPKPDALEKLLGSSEATLKNSGFLSSLVLDNDDNISYVNVPYIRNFEEILASISKKKNLPVISASFGSLLVSKRAIEKVGFPIKELFLWGDDVEYTMRIIKNGFMGYLVLSSVVVHNQKENTMWPFPSMDIRNKKTKYAVRNTFFVIRLRNKILYNSRIRGILGCLNFLFIIVKGRAKYKSRFEIGYFFFVFSNLLASMFVPIIKDRYD